MASVPEEATVVIKSVKPQEIDEICYCAAHNTQGFVSKGVAVDNMPDFVGAKMLYINYSTPFHAAQAVNILMGESARHAWGGGLTRAATKNRLQEILHPCLRKKDQQLSQLFPVFVTGFLAVHPKQLENDLQQLYSAYGPCWVKATFGVSQSYAFVNFHTFDAAKAALTDTRGIKYGCSVLQAATAMDTAWGMHVWRYMKQHGKVSFAELNRMAKSDVRTENGKSFVPRDILRPLHHIEHFCVDTNAQEVRWARVASPVPEKEQPGELKMGAGPEAWVGKGWVQNSRERTNPAAAAAEIAAPTSCASESEPTECGTPSKFVCPISQQLMKDPVRLSNGKAYDRAHIKSYLDSGKRICPLTQVKIDPSVLIPDAMLKAEIMEYARQTRARSLSPLQLGPLRPSSPSGSVNVALEQPRLVEVADFKGGSTTRVYTVSEFLGGGGMGKVYRAKRHTGSAGDAGLALKVCNGGSERNDREAQNLRRLQGVMHDNVVKLFDSGVNADGDVVLVMELIQPGLTLKQLLEDPPSVKTSLFEACAYRSSPSRQFPVSMCNDFMAQMLSGMEAVHMLGVAHRDLKPSNVMVHLPPASQPRVVLIDFGVSKATGGDDLDHTITLTGQTLGTPAYMSPEQIKGVPASHAVALAGDVWALGVIFHLMLEGRHPFAVGTTVPPRTEADKSILIQNIQALELPPLQLVPEAQSFLDKALQKRSEHRFPTAKDMRAAFCELVQQGQPSEHAAKVEMLQSDGSIGGDADEPEPPRGLEEVGRLLVECHGSLQDRVDAARAWFDDKGLDSIAELKEAEMEQEFVDFLQLKEGRARILKKRIENHVAAMA